MNPMVRAVLTAAVAVMSVVAMVAIFLKASAGELLGPGPAKGLLGPVMLVAPPTALAWVLAKASRQLRSDQLRLADDHRRHVQGALVFWSIVCVVLSGWLAYLYVTGVAPQRDTGVRALVVLMGVAMAVRGNFFAKLKSPTGVAAPAPAAWTKTVLRMGWILSLLGALLTLCALILPLRSLFFVLIAAFPVLMAVAVYQRRSLRPRSPA